MKNNRKRAVYNQNFTRAMCVCSLCQHTTDSSRPTFGAARSRMWDRLFLLNKNSLELISIKQNSLADFLIKHQHTAELGH